MKKITILFIFVLLGVMIAACGSSDAPEELLDTTWE